MPNKPTTIQNSTNEKKFGFSTSANELSSATRQFFITALNIAIDTALAIRRTIASITDDNLNNEYKKTSCENLPKESESTYTAPTQNAMLKDLIFNGTVTEDCKTAKTELSTYFKQLKNMTDREYTDIGCTKIADGVYLLGNQIIQDSMLNETKDDESTLNMYQAALALLRPDNSLSRRHISGTNRNKFFCGTRESQEDSCTQIQIQII
jgi:hypothetical protein